MVFLKCFNLKWILSSKQAFSYHTKFVEQKLKILIYMTHGTQLGVTPKPKNTTILSYHHGRKKNWRRCCASRMCFKRFLDSFWHEFSQKKCWYFFWFFKAANGYHFSSTLLQKLRFLSKTLYFLYKMYQKSFKTHIFATFLMFFTV